MTVTVGSGDLSANNDFIEIISSSAPSVSALSSSPSATPSGLPLGSISGNVKEDVDNDDTGEANLVGVTITLLDSSNSVDATTLTDSNGDYLFIDLPVGVYSVSKTNLAGYSDVSDVDGTNDNRIGVSLTFTNLNLIKNDFVDELSSLSPSASPVKVSPFSVSSVSPGSSVLLSPSAAPSGSSLSLISG